jgi:hypothetical protein
LDEDGRISNIKLAETKKGSSDGKMPIIGLPAVGKTTLASALAPLLNAVVFKGGAPEPKSL